MTTDIDDLIRRLRDVATSYHPVCDEAADALRSQADRIAGLLDQHARDSAELRRLCNERDEQKRKVKDLMDYIGICNQANDRMQNAAYESGCPDETDVADWIMESHNSKSAVIHALQKALAYWMPSVFDERSGHDAYLLVGYEGETESECWGDKAKERIQALEAKCAELERDAVWQPIETAPRDGRTLLLGYPNILGKWRTTRGQWMSESYISEYWEDPDDAEPGWYETPVEAEEPPNCWCIEPTHWMPLPAAPIAAQAGSKEGA